MEKVEKKELLDSIDEISSKKELDGTFFILVILSVVLIIALIFPKIYLSNQIYYKSRTINTLLDNYEILKEENRLLRQQLEYERYKNQVLDTMF
ncbi:hypothetical protein NitYY0826_C1276 [Nitratiruptor sp. YY08-26]|uniref:hypothetical protein n=1 Tax=unclassified Nitratiruptor TaxID=2624044 RepID=UPI0019152C96|nr:MULTISPECIES: hypothetical protein [unclassified Nitratiruptor]BCD62400.1 hypothetical protein NitYY0813_C1274 [Nitratiruptor sp. YY08-13]BCD66336.1 hypothetical protein NitYY0826_C1276 [Nitratiruptor sp. YY08-26]